jgi:glycolate oxidase iron-sulfur subunit
VRAGPDLQRRQPRHRRGAGAQRLRSLHAARPATAAARSTPTTANSELATELARRNIDQFPPEQFDAIITNAGGCGSHLKHYHKLLADDAAYVRKRELWDRKLKDVHEWLAQIGLKAPARGSLSLPMVVTYHESCHLSVTGRKSFLQPRQLLRAIPGLKLVELFEANWCCGSAGIYNLTQPEMAGNFWTAR